MSFAERIAALLWTLDFGVRRRTEAELRRFAQATEQFVRELLEAGPPPNWRERLTEHLEFWRHQGPGFTVKNRDVLEKYIVDWIAVAQPTPAGVRREPIVGAEFNTSFQDLERSRDHGTNEIDSEQSLVPTAPTEAWASTSPGNTPEATGPRLRSAQVHHPISQRVFRALEGHLQLKGHYRARDPRIRAIASSYDAHHGYELWHRQLDREVESWIKRNSEATPAEFEAWLRWRYGRSDLKWRFPGGIQSWENSE